MGARLSKRLRLGTCEHAAPESSFATARPSDPTGSGRAEPTARGPASLVAPLPEEIDAAVAARIGSGLHRPTGCEEVLNAELLDVLLRELVRQADEDVLGDVLPH